MIYNLDSLGKQFPRADFTWQKNKFLLIIIERLQGLQWFFVGGIVRDSLLGIFTNDIDITTMASAEIILDRMKGLNVSTIGQRFGTIGVFIDQWKVEITTTRKDINQDGRHTDVELGVSFQEDCGRRDFKFNSLLYDNNSNTIIDYENGLEDLALNKINFIGNPVERIQEDYLRIIRYIRFFVRYGFHTNPEEYEKMKDIFQNNLSGLKKVSMERIINELLSMCKNINSNLAIGIFNECGISMFIFGELLVENIGETSDCYEKLAIIFINYKNYSKLPLPKQTKSLLDILTINRGSIKNNITFLFYKKGEDIAKFYINFLKTFYKNEEYCYLLDFSWNPPKVDLSNIIGPERTIKELEYRYNYLFT